MNGKLISLLALCLLAACQRIPENKPAAAETAAVADLMRTAYGDAVRLDGGYAEALASLPEVSNPKERGPMKIVARSRLPVMH